MDNGRQKSITMPVDNIYKSLGYFTRKKGILVWKNKISVASFAVLDLIYSVRKCQLDSHICCGSVVSGFGSGALLNYSEKIL